VSDGRTPYRTLARPVVPPPTGAADPWRTARAGGRDADSLAVRVDALGELLGLSRTRVSPDALAATGELLARVGERRRLSTAHTVVALAGATGSGKSSLFNALAGQPLSPTGVRRPTTARPIACAWQPEQAAALLDRLGIAPQDRHTRQRLVGGLPPAAPGGDPRPGPPQARDFAHCSVGGTAGTVGRPGGTEDQSLEGLVLIDLPDHDSAATGHREQVDRLLRLVDVVVWVVDPEKYADAALHERYLRPAAGHADVTVLVLNQVDRLAGDTADLVLDDLRRLLDEDGLAVGEHGEDGAVVLAASALTGRGVGDLRAVLAQIVGERAAADRRLAADLDRAASDLHPLYVGEGGAGLTDAAREEFVDRLADAVGAWGTGQSAERDWGRAARDACGTPWVRLLGERPVVARCSRFVRGSAVSPAGVKRWSGAGRVGATGAVPLPRHDPARGPAASRPAVDEAVRALAADAARGLPEPWARAVRDAARRGGEDLPAALDAVAVRTRPDRPERPGWWSLAACAQWLMMLVVLAGTVCLAAVVTGRFGAAWWLPACAIGVGAVGGPLLGLVCRLAARGPARRYGQNAERRLREAAADCGRAGVLEPVAAELMRYREVREQFAVVCGAAPVASRHPHG
jgi:GTPase Era involved in 16S rRNA processing